MNKEIDDYFELVFAMEPGMASEEQRMKYRHYFCHGFVHCFDVIAKGSPEAKLISDKVKRELFAAELEFISKKFCGGTDGRTGDNDEG